jgi:hypothetical protein
LKDHRAVTVVVAVTVAVAVAVTVNRAGSLQNEP